MKTKSSKAKPKWFPGVGSSRIVRRRAKSDVVGGLRPCDCETIGKILECLSECEWALTQAVNHNKVGWTAVLARDNARAMLKKCAESANVQAHPTAADQKD